MTEISDDGNYLVKVRAQVMTRDDSSGGWVPLSGGGLANVSVRRRPVAANTSTNIQTNDNSTTTNSTTLSPPKKKYEYLIYGKRITDQSVVLSCTIKKDFEYNKVMPTFHHWRTGEKKFGLTFQTAADARAFDKGVKTAVEELLEGLVEQSSSDENSQVDGGDEEVFMTLNLPVEPLQPRPSSDTSSARDIHTSNYRPESNTAENESRRRIHYISSPSIGKPLPLPPTEHHPSSHADLCGDNYPYVQLTTLNHDYLYPVIDDQQHHHHKPSERLDRSNSQVSLKKPDILVSQPTKGGGSFTRKFGPGTTTTVESGQAGLRIRCKHCQELYTEQQNPRGACEFAPDPVRRGIATVSCLSCAQCMLYHCMSDAEGDFTQNPCSCSTEEGCSKRWLGLALLSLVVPCLWIYPPLKAAHWCGMSCGLCGGRHHPME